MSSSEFVPIVTEHINELGEKEIHRVLHPSPSPSSLSSSPSSSPASSSRPLRIWCDGCFDLLHWGHANAIRQAKLQGAVLVVGVHSDVAIEKNKGPPLMKEAERYAAVAACKWTDEIVENAPYRTLLSTLERYAIDYCVHGEDISTDEHGRDSYEEVKKAGKFKLIKRAEGVSTTEIVQRIILMESMKEGKGEGREGKDNGSMTPCASLFGLPDDRPLPSSQAIVQFSLGSSHHLPSSSCSSSSSPPSPFPLDRHSASHVVYIDGSWDLFHPGHLLSLRRARALGDYLIVGVHSDEEVRRRKSGGMPVMSLFERALSLLQCRYVDEVIMGSPWMLTRERMQELKVRTVVEGSVSDYDTYRKKGNGGGERGGAEGGEGKDGEEEDRFFVAKTLGLYRRLESEDTLTTTHIIHRIIENKLKYEERQRRKAAGMKEIIESQKQEWERRSLQKPLEGSVHV